MRQPAIVALLLFCSPLARDQTTPTSPHNSPASRKPVCSTEAICFSGEVFEGKAFHRSLKNDLEFALKAGWTIAIVPKHSADTCDEFASVVNAPYRQHRELDIDTSYGWTAEEETSSSPREFQFVTNCADYRTESERLNTVLWPYTATQRKYEEAMAKLGSSPLRNWSSVDSGFKNKPLGRHSR